MQGYESKRNQGQRERCYTISEKKRNQRDEPGGFRGLAEMAGYLDRLREGNKMSRVRHATPGSR